MPNKPIYPWERAKAIKDIDEVLNKGKYVTKEYGIPKRDTPPIFSLQNPGGGENKSDYEDDPIGTAALTKFAQIYPNAYKRAGNIGIGYSKLGTEDDPSLGETWKNPFNNSEPSVTILNSKKLGNSYRDSTGPFADTMRLLRHEFGHVMGLEDFPESGRPGSYNVGDWSDLLDRDIELPPEKKKGIGPSKKAFKK